MTLNSSEDMSEYSLMPIVQPWIVGVVPVDGEHVGFEDAEAIVLLLKSVHLPKGRLEIACPSQT